MEVVDNKYQVESNSTIGYPESVNFVIDTTTGEIVLSDDGKKIQQLNLAAMVMEQLPDALANMSYEALVESYRRMTEIMALRWKVSCSVLAEAYYRIRKEVSYGDTTKMLDAIASDFGIKRKRLYQKIQMWNTFWQDSNVEDRVQPNDSTWVFEQFAGGETYFVAALSANDPIAAINEAERRYYENDENYSASNFRNDIAVESKPEANRVDKIATQLHKTSDNIRQLITSDDDSYYTMQTIADNINDLSEIVSSDGTEQVKLIDSASSSFEYARKSLLRLKGIVDDDVSSLVDSILDSITDCTYMLGGMYDYIGGKNEDTDS